MTMRGGVAAGGLLLALGLGAGIGWGASRALLPAPAAPVAPVALPPVVVGPEGSEEAATIALFRAARDSVVAITTSAARRDLFGRGGVTPLGSGSGFLWDGQGHVVTNAHVIAGATQATVLLADGRSFDARLVGRDEAHDLAVLRIEGEGLPAPLPLAPPEPPLVGASVLAIGNPFGLDWTLTTGIVSALDRDLAGSGGGPIRGLIQTDAAINPGNSGGVLLDSAGRIIGVNTAIYSTSGSSAGIGFAIPVATVSRVVPELIATGRYEPPSLGLVFDARINAAVNRQGLAGAVILDVPRGSAAARAGVTPARLLPDGRIVPGDVVTAFGGEPVATLDDLLAALDAAAPGAEVEVTLRRGNEESVVTLPVLRG